MGGLINQIHALNLKAGLYSTPWVQSYAGYPGGSANNPQGTFTKVSDNSQRIDGTYSFAQNDATQWAAWGIDYLKYDWNPRQTYPVTNEQFHVETATMRQALLNSGRDVVYSYSNSMPFDAIADQSPMLNAWRTTGDIRDNWSSISSKGFGQDKWAPYQSPGHWNDPDMMVVGNVGWGSTQHPSGLTPDEQYTHVTLWSMLSAPLLLGNNLQQMDAFTLNLLTNNEVLAVDQDALGDQATCKAGSGTDLRVYVKDMEDGSKVVGLFNLGASAATVSANWSDVGISGLQTVRDLWRQIDKGQFDNQFSMSVASHGAEMMRLFPVPSVPGVKWKGGYISTPINWGVADNWVSGTVPDGSGVKVSFGDQTSANNVVDMVSVGRTVGYIDFSFLTGTTIQSSGGYNLTLDNGGNTSLINVTGTHNISTRIVLNDSVNISGTGTLNLSGGISGSHGLAVASGNVTLSAAVDYTGTTAINGGKLQLNGENLLPYGTGKGNVNLASNNAILELNNNNTNINGLNGTLGSVRNSGGSIKTLALGNANANGDYGGTIDGNVAVTKVGAGTQTFSGLNTYIGQTLVSAGILKTGSDGALGGTAGGTTIQNGAALDVNSMYLGDEQITVQGSGVGGNGAIVNNNITDVRYLNALRFVTLTGDTTLGGNTDTSLASSGRWDIRANPTASLSTGGNAYNLTKTGGNQVTLMGVAVDSALANVNINQGILSVETTTTLGDPSKTATVAAGATLQFYMLSTPLSKKVVLNGGAIYAHSNNLAGDNTVAGDVALGAGGGVLNAGGARIDTSGNPNAILTISGTISGTSTLTKQGPGTVILTNANTLTGITNLNDGSLVVNGTLIGGVTLFTSPTSGVNTTLSGTGTIGGTTRDAPSTIISPAGNGAAGTFTLNNLTLNGGGQINLDLTNNPAGGNDLLSLTGNLSLAGTSTLFVNKLTGALGAGTYHLLHYDGTATSSPLSYMATGGLVAGGRQTYALRDDVTPKYIDLVVTGTPPAALVWQGNGSTNYWNVQSLELAQQRHARHVLQRGQRCFRRYRLELPLGQHQCRFGGACLDRGQQQYQEFQLSLDQARLPAAPG